MQAQSRTSVLPKGVNTKEPYHYPTMEHDKALFVAVEFQTINSPPLKSEF